MRDSKEHFLHYNLNLNAVFRNLYTIQIREKMNFHPSMFDEIKDEIDLYEKEPKKYLSLWRNRYEPMVYDILKSRYGKRLRTFWKHYTPPLHSDKAVVIVERRCHPNLWFTLYNAAYFCRGWSLYLFCSRQNYEYCRDLLGENVSNVHLIVQFTEHASAAQGLHEYNELLKSYDFWSQIRSETICTMETDCYLRKPIPEEYLEYDFVGTPWAWDLEGPGGTGLTLRKNSTMINVCYRGDKAITMQDSFASEAVKRIGARWLPAIPAGVFLFSESTYCEDPVGVHQWWTFAFNKILDGEGFEIVQNYFILEMDDH
jgi:hypothetical protein